MSGYRSEVNFITAFTGENRRNTDPVPQKYAVRRSAVAARSGLCYNSRKGKGVDPVCEKNALWFYLVPLMAAALYAAVCLELPVQLHIIAPIALLLVLAAVSLRRRKCLLNVFAVLAAAALCADWLCRVPGFGVVPIRALVGETQEITAAALRDAEVYDTDQRVLLLGGDWWTAGGLCLRCYLPETEPPLLAGDRIRVMAIHFMCRTRSAALTVRRIRRPRAAISRARMRPTRSTTRCSSRSWTLNGTACALRRRGSHGSAEMRCSVPLPEREAGLLTGPAGRRQ